MLSTKPLGISGAVGARTTLGSRALPPAVSHRHGTPAPPRPLLPPSTEPGTQHYQGAAPCSFRTRIRTASSSSSSSPGPLAPELDPETAREAIELGNKYAQAARWQEALQLYERALDLPGTGIKRYRDKPRLISDTERSTALFNIACCQGQLGDVQSGLVALAGCLELGYDDFPQLRSDPDLEPLRRDERFEGLLKRFERPSAPSLGGLLGALFGGKK